MESMRRQLSTSLPRQRNEPDLLSEFKAAALSVTNMYKTAAASQKRARDSGYQDALEELSAFLDKENMGLMDGEGWRIRRWITERLDVDGSGSRQASGSGTTATDDEDGNSTSREEDRADDRSSSPETHRKPPPIPPSSHENHEDSEAPSVRTSSEPPHSNVPLVNPQDPPVQANFTFRSAQAYPSNPAHDGSVTSMDFDKPTGVPPIFTNYSPVNSADGVRILPRTSRNNRLSSHHRRNDNRSSNLSSNLGVGAGSKRKLPYSDFFDISGFQDGSDRKDGVGGKRGRHA